MKKYSLINRTPEEQEIVKRGLICDDNPYQVKKTGDIKKLIRYLKVIIKNLSLLK